MKTLQIHFKRHKKIYLNLFLITYGAVSLLHIINTPLGESYIFTLIAFIVGFILAIISHTRHGYETIILLLTHMSLEWWQHAQLIMSYTKNDLLLHGIHAALDTVLLVEESHHFKQRKVFLVCVAAGLIALIIISAISGSHHHEMIEHSHSMTTTLIEALVTGGIIGCILSHLYRLNIKKADR